MKTIKIILICAISTGIFFSCKKKETGKNKIELENAIDSISFYTGVFTGCYLKDLDCREINADIFYKAVISVLQQKKPSMNLADANYNLSWHFEKLRKKQADKNLITGIKLLAENKTRKGVITIPNGIQYEVLKEGTGIHPYNNSKIVIKYKLWPINGSKEYPFENNKIDTIDLNYKGFAWPQWSQAFKLMKTESVYRLYVPHEYAYSQMPLFVPIVKANMAIVADIELLKIL